MPDFWTIKRGDNLLRVTACANCLATIWETAMQMDDDDPQKLWIHINTGHFLCHPDEDSWMAEDSLEQFSAKAGDYYDVDRLSHSRLNEFIRLLKGEKSLPIIPKNAAFGKLLHAQLFEPEKYDQLLDSYLSFEKILTFKDVLIINRMNFKAAHFSIFKLMLDNPATEYEKEFYFDLHGIAFKLKVDAIHKKLIADLKSTSARSLTEFLESCEKFGYFRQVAIYLHGTGADTFHIIGVSKSDPHDIFFVNATGPQFAKELAKAREEVAWYCGLYKQAQEAKLNPVDPADVANFLKILENGKINP